MAHVLYYVICFAYYSRKLPYEKLHEGREKNKVCAANARYERTVTSTLASIIIVGSTAPPSVAVAVVATGGEIPAYSSFCDWLAGGQITDKDNACGDLGASAGRFDP